MAEPRSLTHVILGDGAAGMSAAQVIRSKRPNDRIQVVSADAHPYYYRAALTNYLLGELSDEEVWALPPDGWRKLRFERHSGSAIALDTARRTVRLEDNRALRYDRLLIATGARSRPLTTPDVDPQNGIAGADLPGVSVIRTLLDTRRIIDAASRTKHAVVLGGGILGIEVCQGLLVRNVGVSLLHRGPVLMDRLLDRRAGELVERRMLREGVDVRLNSGIQQIVGSKKRIKTLILKDGSRLPCSLLVVCIGILPNTNWLAGSGIPLVEDFIPVDRRMRVQGLADVWAAGDVASLRDDSLPFSNPSGLWQPARKQGHVAGLGMVASHKLQAAEYRPGAIYHSTRAWDLDLSTLGDHVDREGSVVTYEGRSSGKPVYKKILIRDKHVVGALLLGDRREGHALRHLMNLRGPAGDVSSIAKRILDPTFDLPAWVASRAVQPGVQRWKQTVMIPSGAVPPSVVAAKGATRQLQIALPTSADASLLGAPVDCPLTLQLDSGPRTFHAHRVRVGADAGCDIMLGNRGLEHEQLILSREGLLWVASSSRRRSPRASLNGRRLHSPQVVSRGDLLTLGSWKATVELPAARHDKQPAELDCAWLVGAQRTRLQASVTSLGSGADNDLVVTGTGISPFHAQIHRTGQPAEYYVVDFGGAGTLVNQQRVFSPVALKSGDVVKMGSVSLQFQRAPDEPPRDAGSRPPERSGQRVYLSIEQGPAKGRVLTLPVPGTLGRGSKADVQLKDPLLSRVHAKFELQGDRLLVTDAGSLNGTALDGVRLPVGHATRITQQSQLRMGRHVFRVSPRPPAGHELPPPLPQRKRPGAGRRRSPSLRAQLAPTIRTPGANDVVLTGRGPFTLGRDPSCDGVFRLPVISQKHAEIRVDASSQYTVADLGSRLGTRVNDAPVDKTAAPLKDGDILVLGTLALNFTLADARTAPPQPSSTRSAAPPESKGGFRIDWASIGDPLTKDLRKTVQEELDACIGCHDCMRACPLPDASAVSIGGLNAYAHGIGTPSDTVLRFVDDCTQCQACVPVCPADIQRSRMVLWNKLKKVPSPDQKLSVQVGENYLSSKTTLGELVQHFEQHPVLGVLNGPERMALLGSARFRRMLAGEQLLEEGMYPDALWIVLDGHLETGMTTDSGQFQRMVILSRGQTVGETAVLSDQPSEVSAYATENATVAGLPKYALQSQGQRSPRFREALDALYVSRSMEAFVKQLPALQGVSDELLLGLLAEFDAERYVPGKEVLAAAEEGTTFALIRRGFVREIRRIEGREVAANYLKAGDAFGARPSGRRGDLVRFEAATLAEVFTIPTQRLLQLDKRWPGLAARLVSAPSTQSTGPRAGQTQMFQQASAEGLLQASRLMVIDTRICVDCDNCVTACGRRHGATRLDRSNSGLQAGPFQVPASCYHCDDPVCLLCAVDGIVREPSGEIRIVEDACIGCGACAERCPYDNIQMAARDKRGLPMVERLLPRSLFDLLGLKTADADLNDAQRVAVKCDLCAGFDSGPACVRSCPTGAAQRVDPLKIFGADSAP